MNEVDLKQRAAELEQTLQLQLTQLRKDSEIWLKTGGAALAIGLVAAAVMKRKKKKKSRASLSFDKVTEQANRKIRKAKATSPSLLSPLKKRIFLALFSLGQAKLMEELKKRKETWNEK